MTNYSKAKIKKPTQHERGYNKGWKAFYSGMGFNTNPYDAVDERTLHEGFLDGWGTAQRVNQVLGPQGQPPQPYSNVKLTQKLADSWATKSWTKRG